MSRDPDGMNLPEDYGAQLEPSGTIIDEYNNSATTTPVGSTGIVMNDFGEEGEGQIVLDMTKFIGLPPPPPPITERTKRKGRRPENSMQAPSSPSLMVLSGTKQSEHASASNFNSKPAARSPSSSPRARNIVDERFQLANSTYQSDVLVLDEVHQGKGFLQFDDSPSRQRNYRIESSATSTSSKNSGVAPSTRTQQPRNIEALVHGDMTKENIELSRDIRSEEATRTVQPSPKSKSKQLKRAKKRGFFKKIFGGAKNRETTPFEKHSGPPFPEKTVALSGPVAVDPPMTPESHALPNPVLPIEQAASPVFSRSSKEATKETNFFNNKFSFDTEESDDEKTIDIEDSTSGVPHESPKQVQVFSLDPPDDDNGDPPETSGRPLGSPTSYRANNMYMDTTITDEEEQIRIETVRSRIAEIYGDHEEESAIESTGVDPVNSSEEYPGEEDCLRVETSKSRSMDPVGASPVAQYARGNHATGLESGDPVGETPKAREYSRISSNDPVGASPCHISITPKSSVEVELPPSVNKKTETVCIDDFDLNEVAETNRQEVTIDEKQAQPLEITSIDPVSNETENISINVSDLNEIAETKGQGVTFDEKQAQPSKITSRDPKVSAEANFEMLEPNLPVTQPVEGPIDSDIILSQKSRDSVLKEKIDSFARYKRSINQNPPKHVESHIRRRLKLEKDLESPMQSSLLQLAVKKEGISKEELIEIEKSGFKSGLNAPTKGKESLTVSAAAFTNAKAIAYLHRLEGESSPRHTYHAHNSIAPPLNPAALAKIRMFSAKRKKSKGSKRVTKSKGPSPNEYSAANSKVKEELKGPPKKNYVNHDPKKQFAPYSRFQGRRPRRKNAKKENLESSTPVTGEPLAPETKETPPLINFALIVPSSKFAGLAIARGIDLERMKREGSKRAIITLRQKPIGGNRFSFFPAHESEIKNPIQRAGRRLLSKSAVPIQASFRMFLSKREALNRMWAIVRLQSYVRRLKCETNLRFHKKSALLVQKVYRGHKYREELKKNNACATSIQKIVRGYLAALHAYETIYFISRAQAVARGYLARASNTHRVKAVLTLQAFFRRSLRQKNYAATLIQNCYGEYSSRQHEKRIQRARAIITVQSVVRRRAAYRAADLIRKSVYVIAITRFQATWRGYSDRNQRLKSTSTEKIQRWWKCCLAKNQYKKIKAATKIQASWRGFNAYTDFVFKIVDILVVQRTARQWLARRKTNVLRKERAAIVLQSAWRRKKSQVNFLYSLVSIIIVQSVVRRFLAKKLSQGQLEVREKSALVQHNQDLAATAIQKSWRGFWGFSHFIIVKYEVTRIQALTRGKLARDDFNLKLGCAILIQAVARRYLARKAVAGSAAARATAKAVDRLAIASRAFELRERNSAKCIQFWWRIVMDYTKEKKAALVIEKFFIFVKSEVDREIREMEQEEIMKAKARKKQKGLKGEPRDKDRLNAANQNGPRVVKKKSHKKSAQKSRQSQKKLAAKDSNYESFRNLLDENTVDDAHDVEPMPEFLHLAPSCDYSMVSNITQPSILNEYSDEPKTPRTPKHEEKYKEVKSRPKNKMSTDDYIKKYSGGLQTAPKSQSKTQSQNFSSDDGNSKDRKGRKQSQDGTSTSHAQSHDKASTPRRGRAHTGKPMSLSTAGLENLDRRGKIPPVTPRSRSGSTPRAVSRSRRDGSSSPFRPPVTPTRTKADAILRAATADTECSTLDMERMSIPPRPSPPRRHTGTHSRGGKGVRILKTHADYMDDNTVQEAHEMMLLGDEYGEV